nr:uncharacterized protein LOC105866680 [Microcebus murinus]
MLGVFRGGGRGGAGGGRARGAGGGRGKLVSSPIPVQAAPSLFPPGPGDTGWRALQCVRERERLYTPPPLQANNSVLIHRELSAHARPPRGGRGSRAADCCAPAHTDTHPIPGRGGGPQQPAPLHPAPASAAPSARPASPRLGRGNRVPETLRPALGRPLLPKSRSAGTRVCGAGSQAPQPAPRALAQPCHPGADAEERGSLRPSPLPAAPHPRLFLSSPPRSGHRAPTLSPPRPRRARAAVPARSGCSSPTSVPRDPGAGRARLRYPLGGLRAAAGLAAHVIAGVCLALALGLSGLAAAGTLPSQAPPAPAPRTPLRRRHRAAAANGLPEPRPGRSASRVQI